jgi:hypothetical protein
VFVGAQPPTVAPMPFSPGEMEWCEETALVPEDYGQGLVGCGEEAARGCVEDAGLVWRVVARDGEFFVVRVDHSPQRLTAEIEASLVTKISAG